MSEVRQAGWKNHQNVSALRRFVKSLSRESCPAGGLGPTWKSPRRPCPPQGYAEPVRPTASAAS